MTYAVCLDIVSLTADNMKCNIDRKVGCSLSACLSSFFAVGPQFDALIETLTAREHLMLFARIKGVPEARLTDYVEHLIKRLGLQEGIADKPSKGYSGGNKRKLCVGIALIGNPPIVFLDEPSTGKQKWRQTQERERERARERERERIAKSLTASFSPVFRNGSRLSSLHVGLDLFYNEEPLRDSNHSFDGRMRSAVP
jgi:predicted ABC-type transport system involved in lysophospholipase L1 biosynthesis ATPase subunit